MKSSLYFLGRIVTTGGGGGLQSCSVRMETDKGRSVCTDCIAEGLMY
jgi:hypothetical protein